MFLLIDKPKGITSHDVIDELRKVTGVRKSGHAGTLDPNATGLLIVGVGRESTKKLGEIAKNTKKTYVAKIMLGEERETDDVEGRLRSQRQINEEILRQKLQGDKFGGDSVPSLSSIKDVLRLFIGKQEQVPPKYSAKKIEGQKAYEMARKGKKVDLKARKIVIHSIKLLNYKYPVLCIECLVSSGTYIRALARDIGRKLGMGAYLNNLKRTAIGKYLLKNAVELNDLTSENWKNFGFEI